MIETIIKLSNILCKFVERQNMTKTNIYDANANEFAHYVEFRFLVRTSI